MPIDSAVAELLTAQLFVLVQEAPDPIYFYINSTGIAVRVPGRPTTNSVMHFSSQKAVRKHTRALGAPPISPLSIAYTLAEKQYQIRQ
jgi:hypothetical protein